MIGKLGAAPTLMGKLIKYFIIIIVLMFLLNMYSLVGYRAFYSDFYEVLRTLVNVHSISLEVDDLYQQVENYVHSGSEEYKKAYDTRYLRLIRQIDSLRNGSQEKNYKLTDIRNMVITFHETSNTTKRLYDNGSARIYINQSLSELERLKGYIDSEVKNLLVGELQMAQSYYTGFGEQLRSKAALVYIATFMITLLCAVIAIRFSRAISIPIHELAVKLQQVGEGDLSTDPVRIRTNDEVSILIDSFNRMKVELKYMIERIKEKGVIERKLQEQEIKYLEMSNLLNQSELMFLQSQINPHFLFNTLNSIEVLADVENADKTKKMLESLANIIRHNIRNISTTVTLEEEYEIVKSYLYIQGMRFGNRITYELDIDENVLGCKVPSMILQPFIENAIIHGLEPKEGKGLLKLVIRDKGSYVDIQITDNGVGFSMEKLDEIKSLGERNIKDTRSGIGMYNVIRRLEIAYGENVVTIHSIVGQGTEITMRLFDTIHL